MTHATPMRLGFLCACAASAPAWANPVDGTYSDTPFCDAHGIQIAIEEIGTGPLFPMDELITAEATFGGTACPPTDDPAIPNALVIMTNLSGRFWDNLFYVADPETTLSNEDGLGISAAAPGIATPAFRIDALGINRPLLLETIAFDGIFEPGETWEFIIQDYTNAFGLPASALGSLDFAGASGGNTLSSGSIVQFIPSPGAALLLGLGALIAGRRRRAARVLPVASS